MDKRDVSKIPSSSNAGGFERTLLDLCYVNNTY